MPFDIHPQIDTMKGLVTFSIRGDHHLRTPADTSRAALESHVHEIDQDSVSCTLSVMLLKYDSLRASVLFEA